MKEDDQLIIVDGYSFIFRAYYAMPPLTRPGDGLPVGAVYGFTSMLMKLLSDMKPTHLVIVFDAGKKTYRNDIYPEYKANRPPAPEDLVPQFPLMRDVAKAFNIPVLERVGFEADDVIATLVRMAKDNKEKILIVSSDKDLMQLVNHEVKMYDALRMKLIGEAEVKEKFGVLPNKMRDLLALVGDSVDNIPGLPGIGPKTAAELLELFHDVPGILAHSGEIKQAKRRETIENGKKALELSMSLVSLRDDLDLGLNLKDLKLQSINSANLLKFLTEQGFKSLIARVKKEFNVKDSDIGSVQEEPVSDEKAVSLEPKNKPESKHFKTKLVSSSADLEEIYMECIEYGRIAIYLQNSFERSVEIKAPSDVSAVAIDSGGKTIQILKFTDGLTFKDFTKFIEKLIADTSITKIFYDYKLILHLIDSQLVVDYSDGVDDVMLMSYSLGGGRDIFTFEGLLEFYLHETDDVFSDVGGVTKCRARLIVLTEQELLNYMAQKVRGLLVSHSKLAGLLYENGKLALYQKFDRPLSVVVYNMEKEGLKIDQKILTDLSQYFDGEIKKTALEIYKIAGEEFNIGSPKQLSDILFKKMKLDVGKLGGKSGDYSTDIETLEYLQSMGHTIADFLIKWRSFSKLKTTYTDALLWLADANGRVHTTFSIAYTSTGRFSSIDPNLQNIPNYGEYGGQIRSAFVARPGFKLLSADYSQIELRLLAHIAGVKALKAAFHDDANTDVHLLTASEVFNLPINKVTPQLRHRGKLINFSITYGVGAYGLARRLGVQRMEAEHYIKRYFEKYPEVYDYMENAKKFVHKHGYVETLMGRRCYMRNIESSDRNTRLFCERAAINAPIQGTNADIIRKAMITIHDQILSKGHTVYMLSQVHDELLFEIKDDENLNKIVKKIQEIMATSITLSVPLKVGCTLGSSWGKA